MKKVLKSMLVIGLLAGCARNSETADVQVENIVEMSEEVVEMNRLPEELIEVPDEYYEPMENGGTLVNLNYTTYESFTYDSHSTQLEKRAVVYLPSGYTEEKKYNVLYLMHGGWSDETVYLGSPETGKRYFAHVLDHAIANGEIDPLIVVSPTYNNTSTQDSGNYSLAIQLTDQYHNELINDLIPAVIETFSTYANSSSYEDIVASRDHRGFAGFSMGSVQTWRTFQYNLDAFRYFMPSSGNVGSSGEAYANIVRSFGYDWNDFFIFAASGTEDFAYQSFKYQIEAMADHEMFRWADNEVEGNIYFLEKEGYVHDGYAAMTYFYNGLRWLWKQSDTTASFSLDTSVKEVIEDEAFEGFGRLLFPVDRSIDETMTLEEVTNSSTYVWYSNLDPNQTVEIVNRLKTDVLNGKQVFYSIYSEEEMEEESSLRDTGLFFFRGNIGEKFAIINAGGGFMYVGAMHDSFPHALKISEEGYNAFALIYRPNYAYEDLARAITFIYDHAQELGVNPNDYSLWGGSAGARMAATLGNDVYLRRLTGRTDIPQASAVITQYTGYSVVSEYDAPTYANVGTNDGIASDSVMERRLSMLESLGIPTEFHVYEGLRHGFGIGTGTSAEGWIKEALEFWQNNSAS